MNLGPVFCRVALCSAGLAFLPSAAAQDLPARFEAGRVYVLPRTSDGQVLKLYTDSGGGQALTQSAVTRLHLADGPATDPELRAELGPGAKVSALPAFASEAAIPPSSQTVFPIVPRFAEMPGWPDQGDGLVGQAWFAGHIWTWDYPAARLRLEIAGFRPPLDARSVPLGFKTDAKGARETSFPRIIIDVDGRALPMLLDTGAETYLTPQALVALGDNGPALRATSMIAASTFESWKKHHPDWRVITKAQVGTKADMIEVPAVEIAGFRTGPVWFTERSDASFHKFMSSMMSGQVEGSLGGNALSRFVMTVNYPAGRAWFACRAGCLETSKSRERP